VVVVVDKSPITGNETIGSRNGLEKRHTVLSRRRSPFLITLQSGVQYLVGEETHLSLEEMIDLSKTSTGLMSLAFVTNRTTGLIVAQSGSTCEPHPTVAALRTIRSVVALHAFLGESRSLLGRIDVWPETGLSVWCPPQWAQVVPRNSEALSSRKSGNRLSL
jgi:hypothetical protein